MTKTNAQTHVVATRTRKAKAKSPVEAILAKSEAIADPHALTESGKARKRKSAVANAKSPKSSAQTAIALSPADKAQIKDEADSRYTPSRVVVECKPVVSGADAMAVSIGSREGETLIVPKHRFTGKVAEAAKVGQPWAEFKRVWEAAKAENTGKLAAGLDARSAPHSAASVRDARPKAANKADAVTQKPAKPAMAKRAQEAKAERKAKAATTAAPKADDARKITVVDKKFTYGKEGSSRNASWIACTKAKTVADYAKAGGAVKYLPRWVAAGAIKLG
jgi:hypothetical protein